VEYWNSATPQSGATYYPKWTEAQRRLDFTRSVEQILRQVRAFGPIECIANLGKTILFVRRAVGWTESHGMSPGTVIDANGLSLVVAVADGYVGLTEWSLINPEAVTGTLRR
jgi:methionyl-tRNA formyltransferase